MIVDNFNSETNRVFFYIESETNRVFFNYVYKLSTEILSGYDKSGIWKPVLETNRVFLCDKSGISAFLS